MCEYCQDLIDYGVTASGERITYPRLLHDGKHVRYQGSSGSGKTTNLAYNVQQFLRPYRRDGVITRDYVQVLDFGGSGLMKNLLEEECQRLGVPFKCFHLERDFEFAFDPLISSGAFRGNAARQAMCVCSSFEMSLGQAAERYFARVNVDVVGNAFAELEADGISIPELHQVAGKLKDMSQRPRFAKHAAEALFALGPLLHYPQLSLQNAEPTRRINIGESMDRAECVYFYLPTIFDGGVARAVGTLAMWSAVIEAADRVHRGLPIRHTHLYIDEVAQIAGQTLSDVVSLVRKFHFRLCVAYQTKTQLQTR